MIEYRQVGRLMQRTSVDIAFVVTGAVKGYEVDIGQVKYQRPNRDTPLVLNTDMTDGTDIFIFGLTSLDFLFAVVF